MTTSGAGGGIFVRNIGSNTTFNIENSIIAGNIDNGTAPDLRPSLGNPLTSSHSLIGDTSSGLTSDQLEAITAGVGNQQNVAALLGPLAHNGGPTQTHALLPGSPALGAGSSIATTDQRGLIRNVNGVDIGAYEAQIKPSADFDTDGDVDGSDFLAWQRGFGKLNSQRSDGNSDGDSDTDASDLAAWRVSFGQPQSQPLLAVMDDELSTINSQPTEPARAELIDIAIALAALENEPTESFELFEVPTVIRTVVTTSGSDTLNGISLSSSDASDSAVAELTKITTQNPSKSWLDEELLERVFG